MIKPKRKADKPKLTKAQMRDDATDGFPDAPRRQSDSESRKPETQVDVCCASRLPSAILDQLNRVRELSTLK